MKRATIDTLTELANTVRSMGTVESHRLDAAIEDLEQELAAMEPAITNEEEISDGKMRQLMANDANQERIVELEAEIKRLKLLACNINEALCAVDTSDYHRRIIGGLLLSMIKE